jgi:DNA-binding transcriptional LysR family regulator
MDSTDLAFFAAVAHGGSITRAAARLGTVPSNVTQRVQRLEQQLGVPLFYRHGRGMTLSSAGERLLPYAATIAHTLAEASKAMQAGAEPAGPLLVGAMETTAALRLPDMLVRYAMDFPEVDLILRTGTSQQMRDCVLARSLDAALVAASVIDLAAQPELLAEPVGVEELVLVTAPWVSVFGPASIWSNLQDTKLIVFRDGCSYRDLLESVMRRRGTARLRMMELGSLDAILGCVRAGIGISLLPRALVEPLLLDESLAMHVLPDGAGMMETLCVRRRDGFVSAALAAFLQRVRQQFDHSVFVTPALPLTESPLA